MEFFFKILFISILFERQKDIGRDRFFIYWFFSQMHTTPTDRPGQTMVLDISSGLTHGWQHICAGHHLLPPRVYSSRRLDMKQRNLD